ncbi:copper chaperone CopZ [Thermacetogenium phaeum DSM 12270]|uniref:Copper chaperone CopZ n=1 Tax=Thermacetogenium phaeum (strain ATCC BAA-254 / DSM 26808 / PB) TaxID=1089553 RepID=K4LHF1_THEPS|nr:copper ion binding protein [Thermacetogenium phaeum]AFV11502.1 copper chaperone CopZ [Thermacetogenium phaeum DSM 12270]
MSCRCCGGEGLDRPRKAVLKVTGMSCNHCKKAVEGALRKLDGVQDVQVKLEEDLVVIKYNPLEVGLPEFREAIEEAGYEVQE